MKLTKRLKSYQEKPLSISMKELTFYIIDKCGIHDTTDEQITELTNEFLNKKVNGKIIYLKQISQIGDIVNFRYIAEKLKLA